MITDRPTVGRREHLKITQFELAWIRIATSDTLPDAARGFRDVRQRLDPGSGHRQEERKSNNEDIT